MFGLQREEHEAFQEEAGRREGVVGEVAGAQLCALVSRTLHVNVVSEREAGLVGRAVGCRENRFGSGGSGCAGLVGKERAG